MENYNKIIELLQKKNLSAEEKNLLDSLLDGDNSEELLNAYNLIEKSVKKNFHISTEDIGDYILIKNNQEPVNKNIFKVMPLIEEHFRKCPKCNDEFKLLNNEYTDIDNFLLEKPRTEAFIEPKPRFYKVCFYICNGCCCSLFFNGYLLRNLYIAEL
jgi:hypothetical protein